MRRGGSWCRLLVVFAVLCALAPFEAWASPLMPTKRELVDYQVSANLRVQPAEFELRLTYRDPRLITLPDEDEEREELDPDAILGDLDDEIAIAALHEAIAYRQLMRAERADARRAERDEILYAQQEAQRGFKFFGEVEITNVRVTMPDGKPVPSDRPPYFFHERLEFTIPTTDTGESTVVLRFRQHIDVARQRGFDVVSTVIDWADQWKIPVQHMEVELLFPPDVVPTTSWDCERSPNALRCHREAGGPFPVVVYHERPSFSAALWFPLLSLLAFLLAGGWAWSAWKRDKAVLPVTPPDSGWTPPLLDGKEELSEVDRNAFLMRMVTLAAIFGVAALLVVSFAKGRTWISFRGQLTVVLLALGVGLVVALRPSIETSSAWRSFVVILGAALGIMLLHGYVSLVIGGAILLIGLVALVVSAGGGGGGGGFASSCSSCSSCGGGRGGGCGGGCGGCGG